MGKVITWCTVVVLAVALAGCGQSAGAAGSRGRAVEVPGLGALNTAGYVDLFSVSCVAAGSCVAGGVYQDRHHNYQGFVASQSNGTWGPAIAVPGPGIPARGGDTDSPLGITSVSCASAGNCAAGGDYGYPYPWAFVVTETNGVWGQAVSVPGLDALAGGRYADIGSVSCAPGGTCTAGGTYEDRAQHDQGFVT